VNRQNIGLLTKVVDIAPSIQVKERLNRPRQVFP